MSEPTYLPAVEGADPASKSAPADSGEGPAAAQVSAGTLLRQARESSGLHIAALAVALKVPVRKLECLEADQLEQLPDAVFVRGLTASVCRHLKIDPKPILDQLPKTTAPRLEPSSSSLNSPFRAPGDVAKPSLTHALSRRAMLAVFVLLVGAIVLLLIPQRRAQTTVEAVSAPVPSAVVSSPSEQRTAEVVGSDASQTLPALAGPVSADGGLSSASLAAPVATAANALVTPAVPEKASVASQPVAPALPARAGLVAFSSRGESWVEVTDATGSVTLRRILNPGDTVAASGVLPLSVVVGRSDLTDVTVRGRPFDTARFARDNVARFEVK